MPATAPGALSPLRFRELRELVVHSSGALAMRAMRSLSSFAFNLVLARMLGATGTGSYFLALAVTELATQAARVGMNPVIVRLLAGGQVRSIHFYRRVVALVSAVAVVMTATIYVAAPFLCVGVFAEEDLIAPLRIMALSIVPWSLISIHGSLLQSAGRIALSIFLPYVALLIAGIPFLFLFASDGSLAGAALAQLAATVTVLSAGVILWRRFGAPQLSLADTRLPSEVWRSALRAGPPLALVALLSTAGAHADIFLLGALASMHDVGMYRVAFRIAVLTSAALDAVAAVVAPRLAAYHASGDRQAFERTGRLGTLLAALLSAPYVLIVLVFPAQLLQLFGEEFTAASSVLIVLMIGKVVNTATGPVNAVLSMTGHERDLRNVTLIATVARIVLLYFTIPAWGALGAAVVVCLSDIVANLAATLIIRRKLGIIVLPIPTGTSVRDHHASSH